MLRVNCLEICYLGGDQVLPSLQMIGDERLIFAEGERTLSLVVPVKG